MRLLSIRDAKEAFSPREKTPMASKKMREKRQKAVFPTEQADGIGTR